MFNLLEFYIKRNVTLIFHLSHNMSINKLITNIQAIRLIHLCVRKKDHKCNPKRYGCIYIKNIKNMLK